MGDTPTFPGPGDGAWNGYAGAVTDDLFGAGPEAARLLVNLLDRIARVDGVRFPPKVAHMRRGLLRVSARGDIGHDAQAGSGHADMPDEHDAAVSELWITTAEAAHLLGLTQRQCTRLAAAREEFGLARKAKGVWWIQRDEVAALAAERRSA